jgi:hypothetical protein
VGSPFLLRRGGERETGRHGDAETR